MSVEDNTKNPDQSAPAPKPAGARKAQASNKNQKPSLFRRVSLSPIVFIMAIVVVLVFLPTFVLFVIGMVPSALAFVLDDTRSKSAAKGIAYLNIAGCFIIGMDLWNGDNSFDAVMNLLLEPINLVIMYGMALFGVILIRSLKPFIQTYLRINYQMQQRNLRNRRKALLREWGEAVASTAATEKFEFDGNVYLDEDAIGIDPDENIDILPNQEAAPQVEVKADEEGTEVTAPLQITDTSETAKS